MWNNNPVHLLNSRLLGLYIQNGSENKLFRMVWPRQRVETFSAEHSEYFSFTVKSGMFGNGLG